MTLQELQNAINHPATKIGLGIMMLIAPFINTAINETEIAGIPANNLLRAIAAINIAQGLAGYAGQFFPRGRIVIQAPNIVMNMPNMLNHFNI